jgi:deoxyadenosine/deoxycytidine kinase
MKFNNHLKIIIGIKNIMEIKKEKKLPVDSTKNPPQKKFWGGNFVHHLPYNLWFFLTIIYLFFCLYWSHINTLKYFQWKLIKLTPLITPYDLTFFERMFLIILAIMNYRYVTKPTFTIISMDGKIGAGKTTLLTALKEKCKNYYYLEEPVKLWESIKDMDQHNILEKFYENKKRWSYTFQNMAYVTRMMMLKKVIRELKVVTRDNFLFKLLDNHYVIISERSVATDKNVFAKMLYDSGNIDLAEITCYNLWYEVLLKNIQMNTLIYVKTSTQVCKNRINKRKRAGEDGISEQYLDDLDKYHETWARGDKNLKVLTIDGTIEFETNQKVLNQHLENIVKFIDSNSC